MFKRCVHQKNFKNILRYFLKHILISDINNISQYNIFSLFSFMYHADATQLEPRMGEKRRF